MKTNTQEKIWQIIKQKQVVRPHDLAQELLISSVAVHKHLKKLLATGKIVRLGSSPMVFYSPSPDLAQPLTESLYQLKQPLIDFLNKHYLYLSPTGKFIDGAEGFYQWFINTTQTNSLEHLAKQYQQVRLEANRLIKNNCVNATQKIKSTFKKTFVNGLYYQDFYSLPQFGKTQLGTLTLHAKQSQNRLLMMKIANLIKPTISQLIEQKQIEAVAFIPPSLPRMVQLQKELEYYLHLNLPKIDLLKLSRGEIIVAQKTLAKLTERVINAKETIFVNSKIATYSRVLLLDDAVGSGATFNETAKKLKQQLGVKQVFAFAPVGSYKGFEVIREV